jgi:hypothetical protein
MCAMSSLSVILEPLVGWGWVQWHSNQKRLAADNDVKCGPVGRQSSNSYVSEVFESVPILNNRLYIQ